MTKKQTHLELNGTIQESKFLIFNNKVCFIDKFRSENRKFGIIGD